MLPSDFFRKNSVIATSCKTGEGIEKLKQAIAEQLDNIEHIHDLISVKWLDMKRQLETLREQYDFISYEDYQNRCCELDITESSEQKTVIGLLHNLGVALNYQDDPRLNETNVLNPEWVTSGAYDILNNYQLTVQEKGVLRSGSLNRILQRPQRYRDNKRRFLLRLMQKFELCFPLNEDEYLITDLLPLDEPDVDQYETASLHFQYRYDLLPSSIISRFMVRNYKLIHKTMRWRSGLVVTKNTAKVLIRADEEERLISIKVTGNRGDNLLDIIRTDFEKIHDTIRNLAVEEFLVVKEMVNDQLTGREVPVEYLYLCELERSDVETCKLPRLKGE